MVLDLKTKKYSDLGDSEHVYAFIVVDHQGRAYHPMSRRQDRPLRSEDGQAREC